MNDLQEGASTRTSDNSFKSAVDEIIPADKLLLLKTLFLYASSPTRFVNTLLSREWNRISKPLPYAALYFGLGTACVAAWGKAYRASMWFANNQEVAGVILFAMIFGSLFIGSMWFAGHSHKLTSLVYLWIYWFSTSWFVAGVFVEFIPHFLSTSIVSVLKLPMFLAFIWIGLIAPALAFRCLYEFEGWLSVTIRIVVVFFVASLIFQMVARPLAGLLN